MVKNKTNNKKNAQARKLAQAHNDNLYLASLIAPEYTPPVGVPDEFSELVHRFKIVTQHSLNFPGDKSSGFIFPRIEDAIYRTTSGNGPVNIGSVKYTASNVDGGYLRPNYQEAEFHYEYMSRPSLYSAYASQLMNASGVSLLLDNKLPFFELNTNDQIAFTPRDVSYSGTVYHDVPTIPVGSLARTAKIAISIKEEYGIGELKAFVRTVDINNTTFTKTLSSANTAAGYFTFLTVTVPANEYIVEWGVENSSANIYTIDELSMQFNYGTGYESDLDQYPLGTNAEINLIKQLGTSFRVSALSAWCIYEGGSVYNGKIAMGMVQERDAMSTGKWDYDRLSTTPHCYAGPLNKGAYAFWRPTSHKDYEFLDVNADVNDSTYLAYAIEATGEEAKQVTLRVVAHVEVMTDNQVVGPRPSIVDPMLIWDAQKRLAMIPTGFENDLHLRKIAQVLSKGLTGFGKVSKFLGTVGAAAAIAHPLLGTLGSAANQLGNAATGFGSAISHYAQK